METVAEPVSYAKVADIVASKSMGINKSNVDYATHHLAMAQQSLERATERMHGMTVGKKGKYPLAVADVKFVAEDKIGDIGGLIDDMNKILVEVQELLA